jgi:hypothetical protein
VETIRVIQSFSLKLFKGLCLKETGAIDLLYLYKAFSVLFVYFAQVLLHFQKFGLAPIASLVIQLFFSWLSIDHK